MILEFMDKSHNEQEHQVRESLELGNVVRRESHFAKMLGNLKQLKMKRGKAQRSHSRALKKLEKLLAVPAVIEGTLMAAWEVVEAKYDDMMDRHVSYVLKTGQPMEAAVHQNWVDHRTEEHHEQVDKNS